MTHLIPAKANLLGLKAGDIQGSKAVRKVVSAAVQRGRCQF